MDPWIHTMKGLCEGYDDILHLLENGPMITHSIVKKNSRSWVLTFDIDWGLNPLDPEGTIEYLDDSKLTECIDWVTTELDHWKDVRRISYNMWSFKKKYDAEKFITFYSLSWTK